MHSAGVENCKNVTFIIYLIYITAELREQGRRRRGRPRLRWEGCVKRDVRKACEEEDWKKKTRDRGGWKRLSDEAVKKLRAAPHPWQRETRKREIWVRERTKLIDIIYTVRKMKWSWAGHINRLKDDRWTSRVTTWRPYDKKRRQGRPAKRWRDDLDKYWSDTIWQRTAQDRVIWRRHAEAFAQPQDTITFK